MKIQLSLPTLDHRLWFPPAEEALTGEGVDGLVALGGDFSVPRLLLAYRSGIFPWTDNPISWWSPDPRAVFELETWRPPRRLEQLERNGLFTFSRDRAFREVMVECGRATPDRPSTWISRKFVQAYTRLHEQGHAHSVECWLGDQLAGGIYGVALGGFFAGESMFHRVDNASKLALSALIRHLRARGFELFDIQMLTPLTRQLGAIEIAREEYLKRLARAVDAPLVF